MDQERPARVVPSGKVYRQMFDAEVQLVRALEQNDSSNATEDKAAGEPQEGPLQQEKTIPVVRDTTTLTGVGILTERQKTWTTGFPNETHVENPVLYKYYTNEIRNQIQEPESSAASKEVRGLPDVLTPAKVGSDIIERIAESRRLRHESTLEDMHQELGMISNNLEPQVVATGNALIEKLEADSQVIDEIMARIQDDEDLMAYTLPQLHSLWEEAASHSDVRQAWITQLDQSLSQLEEERMGKVKEIFQGYAKTLEKIAHLMQPDLQRLLDRESQLINQTVLSNRRAYADLYTRLMMSDIEREKRLHTQWSRRVEDWKKLHTDLAVSGFRAFMESEPVTDPPGAAAVIDKMREAQLAHNQKRLDLVNSLREMKPPASTKTAVYKWNQQITDISKDIDQLNQDYFSQLYAEYEKVCQYCLEEVDRVKADLIERGICTEARAQQVINEQCLPLVGEAQSSFEQTLEEMDKRLEDHNAHVLTQLKSLFKFSQGAAHVWDVHEIGLAKQERNLQEKLEECRHQHDNENQDREANLDILMDRMRQDATEEALKDSLQKALDMLNRIRDGYESFHQMEQNIVSTYPEMVSEEVQNYDTAVCRFFSVDRRHPEKSWLKEEDKTEEGNERASPQSRGGKRKKRKQQSASRTSSRNSDHEGVKPGSPLPLAVSEVLSTAKGTTFYVLTVAGEHGIPAEDNKAQDDEQAPADGSAFLTEAPPVDDQAKPSYIENVDVPDDLILEVKKIVRMNFLDHLEDWMAESLERARSVVAAKSEELNSELDLRMHLHQPRARRAELDVHNVRAAELVMHSERVSRHCKGINQSLNDLKTQFNTMTQEHNTLADKFREDIEALEIVFINATKSSKLVALSNQLQVEQEKYMTIIRTSLRQFRQLLDDTLQMLRESNARFIKSFKLFSDGGNFCPEEIEEYRKRLEKMAQKIDSSEGFIMADLEGMESKRLEQATKIASEFEDRFKHHMIDLVFMEKIARWLTNTQVKVKAEVADSNTQAHKLAQALNDLERRIDACEKPNLDKEQVSPDQLNESVKALFEAFHDRSLYLDCAKDSNIIARPASGTLQGNPALGVRVGFSSETMPAVSKPGKQPSEDPSLGVIKNILKTQRTKFRFGADADLDGEGAGAGSGTLGVPGQEGGGKGKKNSRPTTEQDRGKKAGKSNTSSTAPDQPKRAQSGRKSKMWEKPMDSVLKTVVNFIVNLGTARNSKATKFDKRFLIFGEKEEPGEETHFLGKIRHLLREALDGLLSAAEIYYRQKGNRTVTRPQALQETFESCAEVVVQKMQSYFTQADEYHNQCLQEFRTQLTRLEKLVAHVPHCIIKELLQKAKQGAHSEHAQLESNFMKKLQNWDGTKFEHKNELRPTLGHPQQAEELAALCAREEARRQEYLQGVEQHTKALQELAVEQGHQFVEQLAKTSEQLLLQFDNMLTVDEVERGRIPPVKHATSELIRRKNAGQPLEDPEEKETMPRGKNTWTGLPKAELVLPPSDEQEVQSQKGAAPKATMTASVTTAKTTLGHHATVEAREKAYQAYKAYFGQSLEDIEAERQKHCVAEERWTDSWHTSVEKVKQLY